MPGSHPDPSTSAALITTVTSVISPPTNIITYNLATSAGTVTSTVTSTIVIPLSSITTTVTSIISPQTNTINLHLGYQRWHCHLHHCHVHCHLCLGLHC